LQSGVRSALADLSQRLVILGLNVASRAVAGIILRKTFPTVPNMDRFWDASSRFARLSGWLALQLQSVELPAEDAYTFGLFRDCGIPVLLKRLPSYSSVLNSANNETERGFTQVEDAVLPTNHAMVGCVLAQSWWLPEEICLAIRHHHDRSVLTTTTSPPPLLSRKLIAVTQLAEHFVQQQLGLSFTQEWGKLGEACLNLLDLEASQLEALAFEAAPVIAADE
jgi:HD-like signal output (HDOD) protein